MSDENQQPQQDNNNKNKKPATGTQLLDRAKNAVAQQREKEYAEKIKAQAVLVTKAEDALKTENLKLEAIIEEYEAGL